MEEAIGRMEHGEGPDRIEEKMGDLLLPKSHDSGT